MKELYGDEPPAAPPPGATAQPPVRRLEDLVFVGFNSRVAGLDRYTGELVWAWKSPKGTGFVSLLLDGDRLIASVQGYTHCLNPYTGELVWSNPLRGLGLGVASIASVRGQSDLAAILAEAAAEVRRQAAHGAG